MPAYVEIDEDADARDTQAADGAALERVANAMLTSIDLETAELSIVLTGDEQIRRLNAEHRQEDHATDVLAFPMDYGNPDTGQTPAPAEGPRLLGDIVISVPTATRQARTAGHPLTAELRFLLAHGLLHLIGHDHGTPAEKQKMDAATAQLLAAIEKKRGP